MVEFSYTSVNYATVGKVKPKFLKGALVQQKVGLENLAQEKSYFAEVFEYFGYFGILFLNFLMLWARVKKTCKVTLYISFK